MSSKPKIDPYNIKFHGEVLDPYRVADLFGIKDPIVFQMLKKILRFGRKHKSQKQDVIDTITSAIRWLEIHSPADAERFDTTQLKTTTERLNNLLEWQDSMLKVEASWDPQKVGELLGIEIGQPVRKHIEGKIRQLLEDAKINSEKADQELNEELNQ